MPGGRFSSLVGAPNRARSSDSLLPASATAGTSDDERTGATAGAAVAVSPEFGMAVEFGLVDAVDVGAGALRGRVGEVPADDAFAAVGCDEVKRARSSRMLRAASQPDKSNSPIATECLTRLLIVIPAYPKDLS